MPKYLYFNFYFFAFVRANGSRYLGGNFEMSHPKTNALRVDGKLIFMFWFKKQKTPQSIRFYITSENKNELFILYTNEPKNY